MARRRRMSIREHAHRTVNPLLRNEVKAYQFPLLGRLSLSLSLWCIIIITLLFHLKEILARPFHVQMVTAFGRCDCGSQIPHAFVSMVSKSRKKCFDGGLVPWESCLTDELVENARKWPVSLLRYPMGASGCKQRQTASVYI